MLDLFIILVFWFGYIIISVQNEKPTKKCCRDQMFKTFH